MQRLKNLNKIHSCAPEKKRVGVERIYEHLKRNGVGWRGKWEVGGEGMGKDQGGGGEGGCVGGRESHTI